jgi:hypothetical protein
MKRGGEAHAYLRFLARPPPERRSASLVVARRFGSVKGASRFLRNPAYGRPLTGSKEGC